MFVYIGYSSNNIPSRANYEKTRPVTKISPVWGRTEAGSMNIKRAKNLVAARFFALEPFFVTYFLSVCLFFHLL